MTLRVKYDVIGWIEVGPEEQERGNGVKEKGRLLEWRNEFLDMQSLWNVLEA